MCSKKCSQASSTASVPALCEASLSTHRGNRRASHEHMPGVREERERRKRTSLALLVKLAARAAWGMSNMSSLHADAEQGWSARRARQAATCLATVEGDPAVERIGLPAWWWCGESEGAVSGLVRDDGEADGVLFSKSASREASSQCSSLRSSSFTTVLVALRLSGERALPNALRRARRLGAMRKVRLEEGNGGGGGRGCVAVDGGWCCAASVCSWKGWWRLVEMEMEQRETEGGEENVGS